MLVKPFVFGHRRFARQRAVDEELRAAVRQAKALARARLDVDVPALLALLAPVEFGGQARLRFSAAGLAKTSEAAIGVSRLAG